MDDRRNKIKDIQEKMRLDTEARSRLLEGLGETLLNRIGDEDPFLEKTGNTPGGILCEYRRLQNEISESRDIIKSLNENILRMKELEEKISVRDDEYILMDKELSDIHTRLGKALLEIDGADGELTQQQEGKLLAKIEEQESKLNELKEREGGILSWLGKNAQIAVSRTLLQKNRMALQRFYHGTGEKFLSNGDSSGLEGEAASLAARGAELRDLMNSLDADLSVLKIERRKISDIFGVEGSPSKRISGLEKHISHVNGEIPGILLEFGALAAGSESGDAMSAFLSDEDEPILDRAKLLKFRILEEELEIKKIKASLSIDDEHAEIEKMNRAIMGHRQRIADTEAAIVDLEELISKSEHRIEELNTFISSDSGTGNPDPKE